MATRAYLRLDPHVYDRKVLGIDADGTPIKGFTPYKPEELVAFFGVLALADSQSPRGFFRSKAVLIALLSGDGRGKKYARCVDSLIQRGDLVVKAGGWLYVDGWEEWQEGDLTVADRMRRYRARRAQSGPDSVTDDTPPTVTPVTPPVTPDRRARAQPAEAEATAEAASGGGAPLRAHDLASLACRYLPDPGKWLSNTEYAAAWDDLERRFGNWVDQELEPAYGELKDRGKPIRAWDFKRLVEFRCAERVRTEERERQETVRQQLAGDAEKARAKANGLSAEERERQSLMRRAVRIWSKGGIRDKVPESIDELRSWLAEHDVSAQASP